MLFNGTKNLFMKHLYFLLVAFIATAANAQFSLDAGYSLSVPGKEMSKNINLVHSFSMGGMYTLPGKLNRIQGGINLGVGTYANTTKEQTFYFDNGTATRTDVNYSSNVIQAHAVAKAFLFSHAMFNPFASAKMGYAAFYSNIYVEDPDDPGGCKALQQKNIIKDGTFMAGFGAGMQVDWSLFSGRWSKGARFIEFSVSNNYGGNVDYINTKKLIDASNPPTGTDGKPLNIKFINATTQQIHEHQVAEVYNSPVRTLEFRIAAVFSLGGCQ